VLKLPRQTMGNGAFCSAVEQYDEGVQIPTPKRRFSTPVSLPLIQPKKIPVIKPVIEDEEDRFIVKSNADQYSSIWNYDAKVRQKEKCSDFEIIFENDISSCQVRLIQD